jgi:predicted RNA binding protein YcfA (HicA-like mRNA interferase family)
MKLPRDVSGDELAKRLRVFGYQITRQSGSHLRLTTVEGGEHHVTIPQHDPIKLAHWQESSAMSGNILALPETK